MSGRGYLLDTQIVLWDLSDDKRITKTHDAILLGDQPKFFSVASLWEIAIKSGIGKLTMPPSLLATLAASDIILLPIMPEHAMHTTILPHHHGDPFDRLLIAQAQLESLTIVTADRQFAAYDVMLA